MDLVPIHGFVATAVNIFTLLITLYAALNYFRRQELGGDFWGAVAIGEGLIAVQALLGIILLIEGKVPAQWVHILYGVVTAATWPVLYTYTRGKQPPAREALIWMIVSAILFGVTLRARATA